MAYDGITVRRLVGEINRRCSGARVSKIQQPDQGELQILMRGNDGVSRLKISADASLPLVTFTEEQKQSPMKAPAFLMLLRKHIGSARFVGAYQPGNERIIEIRFEHLDEMGDLRQKTLITEIMGRYSNIIFTDEDGMILDSIKHVSHDMSSVREVLPGRMYEYPPDGGKLQPYTVSGGAIEVIDADTFIEAARSIPAGCAKALSQSFCGISYITGAEICTRCGLDPDISIKELGNDDILRLRSAMEELIVSAAGGEPDAEIYYENLRPRDFTPVPFKIYEDLESRDCADISAAIDDFYAEKAKAVRMNQKTADIRHILANAIERTSRKYDLQIAQMKDTEDREKYKIYGELINTYGYEIKPGDRSLTCVNYYDGESITIPLDDQLTPSQNSQKYFAKYNKKKRTREALDTLTCETKQFLDYLLSVRHSLDIAENEADINAIKEELRGSGIIRSSGGNKKGKDMGRRENMKAGPYHYRTPEGYDIYVGRNNMMNDWLTFKFANSSDMWFHSKKMPGSHVIVKRHNQEDIPDAVYEYAASLAALYSAGAGSPKVEIDYTERKNLKKPPAANPGYVIYHTNYSMMAAPTDEGLERVQ